MGRSTSPQMRAAAAQSTKTMLSFWNRCSTSSRSAARWASCAARRRAAAALVFWARRIQRSTQSAALGPMVSDAMSRMSSNSTSPIRMEDSLPLVKNRWVFVSFQYSTTVPESASAPRRGKQKASGPEQSRLQEGFRCAISAAAHPERSGAAGRTDNRALRREAAPSPLRRTACPGSSPSSWHGNGGWSRCWG